MSCCFKLRLLLVYMYTVCGVWCLNKMLQLLICVRYILYIYMIIIYILYVGFVLCLTKSCSEFSFSDWCTFTFRPPSCLPSAKSIQFRRLFFCEKSGEETFGKRILYVHKFLLQPNTEFLFHLNPGACCLADRRKEILKQKTVLCLA